MALTFSKTVDENKQRRDEKTTRKMKMMVTSCNCNPHRRQNHTRWQRQARSQIQKFRCQLYSTTPQVLNKVYIWLNLFARTEHHYSLDLPLLASLLMLQNFKFLFLFLYLPGYPTHSECANIKGKNRRKNHCCELGIYVLSYWIFIFMKKIAIGVTWIRT